VSEKKECLRSKLKSQGIEKIGKRHLYLIRFATRRRAGFIIESGLKKYNLYASCGFVPGFVPGFMHSCGSRHAFSMVQARRAR
jgi:hypothetical protein